MWLKFFDTPARSRPATIAVAGGILFAILLGLTYLRGLSPSSRSHHHYAKSRESRHGAGRVDDAILRRLCEESRRHSMASAYDHWDLERDDPGAWQEVERGVKRAERLLPLAKRLTLESLRHLAADFHLSA